MKRINYNYQQVREQLLKYHYGLLTYDEAFDNLWNIQYYGNHYSVRNRARAAQHVLAYWSSFGLHDYVTNKYARRTVQRLADGQEPI